MKSLAIFVISLQFSAFLPLRLSAQEKIKWINSHDLLINGIKLFEDENYAGALEKFDLIDKNDSLYISAMSEKALTLMKLEKYQEAISVARDAIQSTDHPIPELYINLGSALDDSGDSLSAITVYEKGIELFPMNHYLLFNKAVTLYKCKQYDKSIAALKAVLNIAPKHAGTHYLLGTIAAEEGKTVLAMLSLDAFLMIEPNTTRSQNAISLLQSVATQKATNENAKGIKLSDGDDFSEIELLLSNKLALNKKYKVDTEVEQFDFIRQNHLLFEKLEYDANDKGFWMQFYVPFFKQLFEEDKFEGFSYFILLSVEDDFIQGILKKNMSALKAFDTWWPDAWYKKHCIHSYTLNGKKTEAQFWYSDYGRLSLIGNLNKTSKTEVLTGDYEAYNNNGTLRSKGKFNDSGLKTGECLYYNESGNLEEKINYVNNKADGKYTLYSPKGTVIRESNYSNGMLDGETKIYFIYGGLSEMKNYKADKLDGPYVSYYSNGQKEYEATYKADQLDGKVIKYFPDGKKEKESNYAMGKLTGTETEYYRNGQISSVINYVDGSPEGPYKTYHNNGKLHTEGGAKKGINAGLKKTYFADGTVSEIFNYDETGKLNGTKQVFDHDGKLYYEWDFVKGEITAYRYYDKNGSIINEGKRKLTKFPFTGYFEDGTKRFEGDYDGSEQNGIWKYYDRYGNLSSEEPYLKGATNGLLKSYHQNGKLNYQVNYKAGLRDGYYEEYFPNGKMAEQGWYVDGEKEGYWKQYYANGNTQRSLYYVDDTQHGWQDYFDEKGKPESSYFMQFGRRLKAVDFDTAGMPYDTIDLEKENMVLTENHFNGAVYFVGEYKNGDANGSYKWYGASGQLSTECTFLDNQRDGFWKWYDINGKVYSEGNYDLGNTDGIWKDYWENGQVSYQRSYLMGSTEGEIIRHHKNGQTDMTGPYLDDLRNGTFQYYDELGELQIIKYFSNGKLIGYSYNGPDGKPVPMIPLVNGSATITAYFKNGKKSVEYTMEKGMFEGKYMEYFSTGKLYEESFYKNDELDGDRKVYYPTGKLRYEEHYNDGYETGLSSTYAEDGKLLETNTFYYGDRYGERQIYNSTGKIAKTIFYYNDKIVYEK